VVAPGTPVIEIEVPRSPSGRWWPVYSVRGGPVLLRFMAKVEIDWETGCWIWIGSTMPSRNTNSRYGRITVDNVIWPAHRFAYHYFVGRVYRKKEIDHICENTLCVYPGHLRQLSRTLHRMLHPAGSANWRSGFESDDPY
jgi:hypothetical protein